MVCIPYETLMNWFYFEKGVDLLQSRIEGIEYGMDILNDLNGSFCPFIRERKTINAKR